MQFRLALLTLLILCYAPFASGVETKDVKIPVKNAAPVVFSHEIHLKKYNNNCKVCHNAIFNLKDRQHYTMADMEKTKSCGACHTGVKAFSVADSKFCVNCHKDKPRDIEYKIKNGGEVTFSHNKHLAKVNNDCHVCHPKIITGRDGRVTMAQMQDGKTCGACHNGKKAFTVVGNCNTCHKGLKTREITFKVKGVGDATFSHDFHTSRYGCKECHTRLFDYKAGAKHYSMKEMGNGKSCGACHNGKQAFAAIGDCNKCHKGYRPPEVTFKTEAGNVKFSHALHIKNFKCNDCHTKIFPFQVAGAPHYTMGAMDHGKSCGACHNGKDAFSSSGDCESCHTK
jgi:c(7)-type cytochrome triheme protein